MHGRLWLRITGLLLAAVLFVTGPAAYTDLYHPLFWLSFLLCACGMWSRGKKA